MSFLNSTVLLQFSLLLRTSALTIAISLVIAMVAMFWLGRFVKKRFWSDVPEEKGGPDMLQSSLFALLGFLLAFTFGMSGSRYNYIRDVTEEESNAIGTAILRADLYPDSVTALMRYNFKNYLEARINTYENVADLERVKKAYEQKGIAEKELWGLAARQSKLPNMLIPSNQMVPALNQMFDMGSKRDVLARTAIPDIIIYMLLIMALLSTFIAGIVISRLNTRDWIIIHCFIIFTSLVIFVTIDLGRPFRGLIRASAAEQSILDLRELVKDVPNEPPS